MVENESALDSIANFYALKYLTYGLSGISNRPNKSCKYTDRAVVDTHLILQFIIQGLNVRFKIYLIFITYMDFI